MVFSLTNHKSAMNNKTSRYPPRHDSVRHLNQSSGRLVHCIGRQRSWWEAPIGGNGIISPPIWKRLVRQVKTEDHDCLHELCSAIETNAEQVVVLAEPDGMVPVYVSHTIGVRNKQSGFFWGKAM
jgi:hypothetical protein